MLLNFKSIGQGKPLIILHGLFGMLDNWQTIARALENEFTLYLVDQRNHGKSPHTDQHSYKLMANDLLEFMTQQGIPQSNILGHSMGGKTAMQFALDYPEMVNKLIVVDMGVKQYEGGHDTIFDALKSVDLNSITNRHEADVQLSKYINSIGVKQFLLKNLTREPDGSYHWKFNLKALSDNYQNILASIDGDFSFEGETLFIRGSLSDYIPDADWEAITKLFPMAKLETISNAGHWVHADQPEALLSAIRQFL
mgnify:CR=1 FL=1